jgi:hypothetical protein
VNVCGADVTIDDDEATAELATTGPDAVVEVIGETPLVCELPFLK